MLKYLEIRNFVLIDKLKINFNNGFNVLTGETGAGKSIIISALELITGEKGSTRMVGANGDRLIVMGCFSLQSSSNIVQNKLKEWNIEINNNELNITQRLQLLQTVLRIILLMVSRIGYMKRNLLQCALCRGRLIILRWLILNTMKVMYVHIHFRCIQVTADLLKRISCIPVH